MSLISRLDHTAIAADNTDSLVAWYQRVLGFHIAISKGPTPPQTQKVYLIGPALDGFAAGSMLEIMPKFDVPRHTRASHDPGISHIAFAVQDFDAAHTQLKTHHIKFLSEVIEAVGGGRLLSFEDPEGNFLQIVERR